MHTRKAAQNGVQLPHVIKVIRTESTLRVYHLMQYTFDSRVVENFPGLINVENSNAYFEKLLKDLRVVMNHGCHAS